MIKRILASTALTATITLASASDKYATFTYFQYEGADSLYRKERLASPGDFFNPVISGWASDPSIVRVGEDYWLVTSTFGFFPGVPLYRSRDLVNWEHVGNVLSRPSQLPWLEGLSLGKEGIYAPAIAYNPANKLYYMITTCVTPTGTINFYVTTPDPMAEWSDPVVLEDVVGIDPSFFFDDNGKAYIIHKAEEHSAVKWSNSRALAIIEFDTATGKTVGKPVKFKEAGVGPEEKLERDEGAHIYKINGKYYLIAAEGGTGAFHSEVCYKSDSPWGPWQRWGRNPMLTQRLLKPNRANPVTCTGHADLVTTPQGEWYAVFLGCRPWDNGTEQLGRETFLMPVKWSRDSFPYITQSSETVPLIQNRPATAQSDAQAGNVSYSTDFFRLTPEWLSLWGSPDKYLSTGKEGLQLTYAPVNSFSGHTPAFIGHRIQNIDFSASTLVIIPSDATPSDAAGLLVVKNERRQIFFAVYPDGIRILLPGGQVIGGVDMDTLGKAFSLKIVCSGGEYSFFYSCDVPGNYIPVPAHVPSAFVSSSAGGFTGTILGPFATSLPF